MLPRLVHLCSLLGAAVRHSGVFHKYLLWSDTTAPNGLYARLCHAFLVYKYQLFEKLTKRRIAYFAETDQSSPTPIEYAHVIVVGRSLMSFRRRTPSIVLFTLKVSYLDWKLLL